MFLQQSYLRARLQGTNPSSAEELQSGQAVCKNDDNAHSGFSKIRIKSLHHKHFV